MNNKDILANAPDGATHYVLENGTSFHFKIDDKEASIYTDEWDCYTNHKDVIPDLVGLRSLADIKRIVELENCLINMRELLSCQKDKSCLGTGYPANENDCAPWPIVDEAINEITQALKAPKL